MKIKLSNLRKFINTTIKESSQFKDVLPEEQVLWDYVHDSDEYELPEDLSFNTAAWIKIIANLCESNDVKIRKLALKCWTSQKDAALILKSLKDRRNIPPEISSDLARLGLRIVNDALKNADTEINTIVSGAVRAVGSFLAGSINKNDLNSHRNSLKAINPYISFGVSLARELIDCALYPSQSILHLMLIVTNSDNKNQNYASEIIDIIPDPILIK